MKYRTHYFGKKANRLKFYLTFFVLAILVIIYWGWGLNIFKADVDVMSETGVINIDAGQDLGELKNNIFGVGVSGVSADLFRSGISQAIKNGGIKFLRINADGYINEGFTRAIGPVLQRVPINITETDTNFENKYAVGPDEWGKTAKNAGADLMVTLTFKDGSQTYLNQYKNLLEYMNIPVSSEISARAIQEHWTVNLLNPDRINSWGSFDIAPKGYFAWLRVQFGGGTDPGPYNLKYLELGNEVYGNWYSARMPVDTYAQKIIEWGNALKTVDGNIKVGVVFADKWIESAWDQGTGKIWNEEVANIVISNALGCQKDNSCQRAIDFVIPHYYDPSLRGKDDTQTFTLFNPRSLSYKFSNGSDALIQSEPVVHVRSVELGPGNYTFSLDAIGQGAINLQTNNDEYPKIKIRLIDDGGQGNSDSGSPLVIEGPGAVYESGVVSIDSSELKTYSFSGNFILTKPNQKYRLEILLENFSHSPSSNQQIATIFADKEIKNVNDYMAQSFISNDKNVDDLKVSLLRTEEIAPQGARVYAEIYPDSGADSPDMSVLPLAKFEFDAWVSVASFPSYGYSGEAIYKKTSPEKDNLAPGSKYWIVQRLDRALTLGSVLTKGNDQDSFSSGSFKTSDDGGSLWQVDSKIADSYFSIQKNQTRISYVKNLRANDNDSNATTLGLNEKEFYEGLALSGQIDAEVNLKKLNNYLNQANQNLKIAHPEWLAESNYIPEVFPTEYGYLNSDSTDDPTYNQLLYRNLFTAIHDANKLVSFINSGASGSAIWTFSPQNSIYEYQDQMGIVKINSIRGNSPASDNPDLYLYTPRYYLLKIFSENHGDKIVKTDFVSPKYAYNINYGWSMLPDDASPNPVSCDDLKYYYRCWANLIKTPAYPRPYLNGYTSLTSDKTKLFLTVVNSNADRVISSEINLLNFTPKEDASVKTLNTRDVTGMKASNGFRTWLDAPMPKGSDRVVVKNASDFRVGDLISVQSTSHGEAEFFKVRLILSGSNTLYLNDLDGSPAQSKLCYEENYVSGCNLFQNTQVINVTGNVNISNSSISNAGSKFDYKFPAHSVTVIEFNKNGTRAEPDSSPSIVRKQASPTSKIKTSPSASITPTSDTSSEPVSELSPTPSGTLTPPIASVDNQTPTPTITYGNENPDIAKTPAQGENTLIAGDKNKTIIVIVTIIVVLILGALGLIYRLFYYRPGQADRETKI